MAFALKEWSVACDALVAGVQTVTIRKGGIEEEDGEFRPRHEIFYLYPTLEHQRASALRPAYRENVESADLGTPGFIQLHGFARCERVTRVDTEDEARRIASGTIWTEEAMAERFRLYPTKPLWFLGLRVFRLFRPVILQEDRSYAGCRSWVPLIGAPELPDPESVAAVDDETWKTRLELLFNPFTS